MSQFYETVIGKSFQSRWGPSHHFRLILRSHLEPFDRSVLEPFRGTVLARVLTKHILCARERSSTGNVGGGSQATPIIPRGALNMADVLLCPCALEWKREQEPCMQVVRTRIRCFRRWRARQGVILMTTLMGALSFSMCSVPRSVWTRERFAIKKFKH